MRILTYQELETKDALLPLMEQAFGWPFDPTEFEKTIKVDARLRDSCVGFCAVDDRKVLGYVGVMELTTRTVDDTTRKEGGIYGVATLPGNTRQGICTALMERAHEYLREKGYRFAFLTTSPTIVAHALYERLGYSDALSFSGVYKIKERVKKQGVSQHEKTRLDLDRMLEIYRGYVKNMTGLVVRNKKHMQMLAKTHEITARECILDERGYVVFKKDKKQVRIRELVAHDKEEMNRLIGLIEERAQTVVYGRAIVDPALRRVFASRGFTVLESGHGVLMVKEFTRDVTFNETYGGRFFMSALDYF